MALEFIQWFCWYHATIGWWKEKVRLLANASKKWQLAARSMQPFFCHIVTLNFNQAIFKRENNDFYNVIGSRFFHQLAPVFFNRTG